MKKFVKCLKFGGIVSSFEWQKISLITDLPIYFILLLSGHLKNGTLYNGIDNIIMVSICVAILYLFLGMFIGLMYFGIKENKNK